MAALTPHTPFPGAGGRFAGRSHGSDRADPLQSLVKFSRLRRWTVVSAGRATKITPSRDRYNRNPAAVCWRPVGVQAPGSEFNLVSLKIAHLRNTQAMR